jgi:DNA-directed RNA polymerase subunit E'/Rpb7
LKGRQFDDDDEVRFQVVKTIAATTAQEFSIVCENEDLLDILKGRMLDQRVSYWAH